MAVNRSHTMDTTCVVYRVSKRSISKIYACILRSGYPIQAHALPKKSPKEVGKHRKMSEWTPKKTDQGRGDIPKKAFGRVMDESWVNAEPWCGGGRLYATLYIKTSFSHTPSSPTYSYLLPSFPLSSFRHPPTANGLYSQVAVQLQISASVSVYILFATRSPAHHVCRRSAHDPSFREGRE